MHLPMHRTNHALPNIIAPASLKAAYLAPSLPDPSPGLVTLSPLTLTLPTPRTQVSIYKSQASALAKNAAKGVKVVVVANPANTNALILKVPCLCLGLGFGVSPWRLPCSSVQVYVLGCEGCIVQALHFCRVSARGLCPHLYSVNKPLPHPSPPHLVGCTSHAWSDLCPTGVSICHTCLSQEHTAGGIPPENITCLTRLDHNRALSQVCHSHVVMGGVPGAQNPSRLAWPPSVLVSCCPQSPASSLTLPSLPPIPSQTAR